jgi:hypothetical protein
VIPVEQKPTSLLGKRVSTMTDEELDAHVAHLRSLLNDIRSDRLHYEPRNGASHQGFVFIQSHPAMPGLLKIGITSVSEFDRNTGIDTGEFRQPLQLRKIVPVFENLKEAGKRVFRSIVAFRESGNREFFRLSLRQAIALVECALDGTDSG